MPYDVATFLRILEEAIENKGIPVTHFVPRDPLARRASLGSLNAKVFSLQKEITLLERLLSRSRQELREVERLQRTVNNSLQAVERLPNEILAEIFRACHESLEDPHKFLLAVTNTSQRWRNVAIHTSSLWRLITFKNGITALDQITESLRRSGKQPLIIRLTFNTLPPADVGPMMDFFGPYLNRCHEIRLFTRDHRLANRLLPIHYPMPALRELHASLAFDDPGLLDVRPFHVLFTNSPPLLSTLILESATPRMSDFHASSLRNLVITNTDTRLADVLSTCRRLQNLKWASSRAQRTIVIPPSAEALELPYLSQLDVSGSSQELQVLRRLIAPSVKTLMLSIDSHTDEDLPLHRAVGLTGLEHIWIGCVPGFTGSESQQLVQFLSTQRYIRSLALHYHPLVHHNLARLLRISSSAFPIARDLIPCPDLRLVHLHRCDETNHIATVSEWAHVLDTRARGANGHVDFVLSLGTGVQDWPVHQQLVDRYGANVVMRLDGSKPAVFEFNM